MNKKAGVKLILIIIIAVVLIAAVYFTFFFAYSCDDIACFRAHQEKCSKTKFVNDAEGTTWFYNIKGKEGGRCKISVEVLQLKEGAIDKKKLEGKSMDCYLPLGGIALPEADISKCHGVLKEELQSLIIQKLHAYIVDNLGEIGEELEGIIPESEPITNSSE